MQLQRYLSLDGIELINGKRTAAYVGTGLLPGWELPPCPPELNYLLAAVPDGDYVDPVSDPAPWIDGHDNAAEHFFGIAVRSFTADLGPIERVNGSNRRIGRLQMKTRRFTLEGDLLADDCCGTDFGRRWLLSRFGVGCGTPCTTQTSQVAVCQEGYVFGPFRTSYRVGLVSFEDLSEEAGLECCFGMRFRLVFDAEDPWFYGPDIELLAASNWPEPGSDGAECTTFVACTIPDASPCVGSVTSTIAPNPLPVVSGPLAPGGTNVPWCEPLTVASQCVFVDLAPYGLSDFGQAALRFTVEAGAADMENARIRIYDTTGDSEAACEGANPDDLGEPFAELDITFIPAGSTLVVDGAAHTILLYCPDLAEWINADHLVYGPTGAFYRHPVVGCDTPFFCVCMTVDGDHTAADATFTVEAIPRFI
jgi:hypothetical protein